MKILTDKLQIIMLTFNYWITIYMNEDLYSGAIDWDRIYRTFHNPFQIAIRVQQELGATDKHLIFSGFQETASYLAKKMPVTFVDNSPSITNKAKKQYRELYDVRTGDVTQIIEQIAAPSIVIACRISAYWDSIDYFERLAASLRVQPRETVLIDFFDRALVKSGKEFNFKSDGGVGDWTIIDFKDQKKKDLSVCNVKLKVSYSLYGHSFSYEGYRSFFRKQNLFNWFNLKFPNYKVTLGVSLIAQDPSFSLKLTHKFIAQIG